MIKKNKYNNRRGATMDGKKFDSVAELMRYQGLLNLQEKGLISDLQTQVSFTLAPSAIINGKKSREIKYVADFVYKNESGAQIVEDTKGMVTAIYKIKRHLMKTVHGIDIKETN